MFASVATTRFAGCHTGKYQSVESKVVGMNAKSGNHYEQKKQNPKTSKVADGLSQTKKPGKMQMLGKVGGKKSPLQGGTLSKYCWQSNELEQLLNPIEKTKPKNGF